MLNINRDDEPMNINQKLHELQGLKQVRYTDGAMFEHIVAAPSYTTDEKAYWKLLQWCKQQGTDWDIFCSELCSDTRLDTATHTMLINYMLDMQRGCEAIAAFDWSKK